MDPGPTLQTTHSWSSPAAGGGSQSQQHHRVNNAQSPQQRVPEQKVILLGDFGVGKTSLFRRFTNNTFTTASDRKSTLGLDFYTRAFSDEQGDTIKMQLWDTGGMERVASITSSYYKFAEAAILVFDVSNPDTFHSLAQHLLEVASYAENCKVFLCGNKTDLVDQFQEIEEGGSSSSSTADPHMLLRDGVSGGGGAGSSCSTAGSRSPSLSGSNQREYDHVSLRDMEQFCEQTSVITNMYVTSCKTNRGVPQMFSDISRQIKSASRARYELAKHSILQDELPFQLSDGSNGGEENAESQQCAC